MTEERDKAFRKKMEAFPCHFNLDIKFGFTTVKRRNIIGKLSDEMETTGFELDAESTRAYNVLSFLHWRLGDYKNAKMYSEKALLIRQDDVMALANQAWMHWKRYEVFEAQCILEKLEQLKGRRDLIIISKAEQAFAYTRFGPKYYNKAIKLFQDVIASAIEFKLEETYINLWKFGLGLILKRQLQFLNVFSFDHLSTPVDSFRYAISVLFDVAQNANTPRYKARAWVSLGELAHSIHDEEMLSPQDKEDLPKEFKHKTTEEFFDIALNICHDDVYVLGRYGRQARYSRDYNKSIQLLRQSVEIRGTSLGHHHLAKAIKSALNKEIGESVRKKSRGLCEIYNPKFFCTPVKKGCDGGYKKFLENQTARRNLFPNCEQNMEGHGNDKVLGNSGVFENNPLSLSSAQSSVARKSANIECRGSFQRDSGIFSLTMTDDLTAKLALFNLSDAAPTSYLEGKDESYELQRQALNTFSDGDQAKALEKDLTCSDGDQAKAVDKNLVISSRKYNPSSVGAQQGHGHKAYGGGDSEHSFSGRGYQNMRAWHRGRTRGPQGIRFGGIRGRGQIWGKSQSSEPLFPRSEYYQSSASTSKGIISRQISSLGGQDKLENRPFQSQQSKVIMRIGSPPKVLRYPKNDKRVEEILDQLEKSLKYAPSNCAAIYDKGLVFRSLGHLQDAIELFIKSKSQKECSPWQAVLCMEQHALCLQEIAETENAPDIKEALYTNMKELLFEAMEKAASITTWIPFYQPRSTAFPSLKEMLLRQDKGKIYNNRTTLKEFARLYELIGKYGHALSFYTKISEMSETDSKDPEILLKMAQNYVKQRDFRNSLLFFNLIEASCSRLADDNRKLYFEAYLEGALYALEQDNVKEANSRFKRTVRFCSQRKMISEDDDEEWSYDIHIQTSRDAESNGLKLFDLLAKTCGLKVSLNDYQTTEEFKYGGIYEGIGDIMEQSCLVIFIFDDVSLRKGDLRYYINMAVELNVESSLGTGIISICLGELNTPVEIKSFPVFLQPQHLDFSEKLKNENSQWLRDFFWKATEQPFPPSVTNDTDKTDSD